MRPKQMLKLFALCAKLPVETVWGAGIQSWSLHNAHACPQDDGIPQGTAVLT